MWRMGDCFMAERGAACAKDCAPPVFAHQALSIIKIISYPFLLARTRQSWPKQPERAMRTTRSSSNNKLVVAALQTVMPMTLAHPPRLTLLAEQRPRGPEVMLISRPLLAHMGSRGPNGRSMR